MKLSQLIKDRESFEPKSEEDFFVFGVEIDVDDVTPPASIREIGIIARTEDGELVNEVLDVAISYILAGIDVLIEYPADVDIGDPRHLMATAASVNASLSFLPPADITDESFEAYCQKLEVVTLAYLKQLTMTKFVMPVTNYLHYLYVEALDPEASRTFIPEDGYVIDRFHQSMTIEQSDLLKARLRKVVFDHFGGEEAFRDFTLGLMGSLAGEVEASLSEIADEKRRQVPPQGWYRLLRKREQDFVMSQFDGKSDWTIYIPSTDAEPGIMDTIVLPTSSAGRDYVLIEAADPPGIQEGQAEEAS